MSRLPSVGAFPSISSILRAMRAASGTPRRRMPTRTRSSTFLLRSTISCAMRMMMRRKPSASMISAFSLSATAVSPIALLLRQSCNDLSGSALALHHDSRQVPAAQEERSHFRQQLQPVHPCGQVVDVYHHVVEKI